MVSVVMPVYNVENYIRKSIASVLEQTYMDVELVIIDDGSTDGTSNICDEYAGHYSNITCIHKINEGQGVARTMGYMLAKGEYITYLDGDDWLEPQAIEQMMIAAQNNDVDMVVADCYYVYIADDKLEKKYSKIRYESGAIIGKEDNPEKINLFRTFSWAKLYRREFLLNMNFYQPSYAYEDVATIPLLIAKAEKIAYVGIPVYNYLKTRNESTIHNENKIKDMKRAIRTLYSGFLKLEVADMYKVELKRLIWSQIRFMCIQHNLINHGIQNKCESNIEELNEMLQLMKELYPDFMYPDSCNIKITNNRYLDKAICKLLINPKELCLVEDMADQRERISISWEDTNKEYIVDSMKYVNNDSETIVWNIADDIFRNVWG
ncbi:MAG: glycosyltransferase family 2 protein [Lachnospiraceae bacterium]|nr:glycosyltransferase family 2 protein [Lachnospiraceae bacterium]